jgi:hypothetical protein
MVFLWRAMNSRQHKLRGTVLTIQDRVLLHGKTISHLMLGRGRCAEMLGISVSYIRRL